MALVALGVGPAGAGPITDDEGNIIIPVLPGTLTIGSSSQAIPATAWEWDVEAQMYVFFHSYSTSEGSLTISGGLDPDPIQAFAASVVDIGAPSTFSFTLSAPIVLPNPSGFVTITGDISGSFSEGTSPFNGGSVSVVGGTLGIAEWDVNGVFLLGNGGSYTYPTPSPPSPPLTQNYPTTPQASLVFDCSTTGSGNCDTFSTHISFTGGGGGDGYAFTTTGTINNVPEPAAGALLGLAGLALGLHVRRTRVA